MYLWLSVILVIITVIIIIVYFSYKNKSDKSKQPCLYVSENGKEVPVYNDEPKSKTFLAAFCALFLIFAFMIIYFAFRLNKIEASSIAEPTLSPSAVVAATHTPEPTASPMPVIPPLPDAEWIVWLDDLTPFSEYKDNFTIGGWSDRSSFLIGQRNYTHGIGMQICGTTQEKLVNDETTKGVSRHTCKMSSMSYALRGNYSKIVFSLGVDAGVKTEYGPKEKNGEGRIVLADTSRNGRSVLFDTGWRDYTYTRYEIEIPLENVDFFEISIMSKDFKNSETGNGLRFAIIDPILYVSNPI